jgi:hypothetical protein
MPQEKKDAPTEIDMLSLQHKFDVEDRKENNQWHSCCLVLDRRAVQYFTQMTIIAAVMLFTIYQLCTIDTCESQSVYIGLLTMLIGVLIPSPKFQDKQANSSRLP